MAMRLQDGDSVYGTFLSPSGRQIKSYSTQYALPPEGQVEVRFLGSLSSVVEVFGTFSAQKKEILKCIKFDGVLELARCDTLDLYFYLWLLTRIDSSTCSIRTKGSEELPIRDRDVGHILGIPWYGIEMVIEPTASHDTIQRIRQILCVGEEKPNISMGHITKILTKTYHSDMSNAEIDAFKVAAVVFIMTNIIATGGNSRDIPLGLLRYLTNPSEIDLYNWGLLVRRYLVSWSHFVSQQLRQQQHTIIVGGCFLLPMTLYLDNLMLGSCPRFPYQLPRAKDYNKEKFKAMIAADTTTSSDGIMGRLFGKSELKRADMVYYGRWLVDNDAKRAKTAIKLKSGMDEQSDRQKRKSDKGMVAKLVLLAANKRIKKEIIMATGLAKIHVPTIHGGANDLFEGQVITIMNDYIEAAKKSDSATWDKFSDFYHDFSNGLVYQMHKQWVLHLQPFEIKISGSSLAAQLNEGCPYYSPLCDAVLRSQVQYEDKIFTKDDKRHRHLMATTFLESYRERKNKGSMEELRMFFIGDHVKYKVTDCIQINMLVSIRRKWSCYSWNLVERTLTVLDPQKMGGQVELIKHTHEDMVSAVNSALLSCLQYFFPGWTSQVSEWTIIYRNDISVKCNWNNTGLYSLHYALHFNTDDITDEINSEDDFIGRKRALWNILDMEGNIGEKPDAFYDVLKEHTE